MHPVAAYHGEGRRSIHKRDWRVSEAPSPHMVERLLPPPMQLRRHVPDPEAGQNVQEEDLPDPRLDEAPAQLG